MNDLWKSAAWLVRMSLATLVSLAGVARAVDAVAEGPVPSANRIDLRANAADPPDGGQAPQERSIQISVVSATSGKPIGAFRVLAGVESGAFQSHKFIERVGEEEAKNVAVWQPHTIRSGTGGRLAWPVGRTYPKMRLRVEAGGYQAQLSPWITKGAEPVELEFRLIEDWRVEGVVLRPDGQPAAGATVALALPNREVALRGGQLAAAKRRFPDRDSDRWRLPIIITADEGGRIELPFEPDVAAAVLAVHDSGVRELPYAEFRRQPKITLSPWGRIEGEMLWQDTPGADLPVHLIVFRDDYGYPGVIAAYADTRTDAKGRFVFERVLPGAVQLSRPLESRGATVDVGTLSIHVDVKAGEPARPILGGRGRTVRGRLTGRDHWEEVTMRVHPDAPHIGFPGDDEMWQTYGEFQASEIGPLFFRDRLRPGADGTFELTRILPGRYQLFVSAPGVENHAGYRHFDVPPETVGEEPVPLDLGEIAVKAAGAAEAGR